MPALPRITALVLCLACGGLLYAEQEQEREAVEAQLQSLEKEIGRLVEQLAGARDNYRKEQQAVRRIDLAVQEISLRLRELARQLDGHNQTLGELEAEQARLLAAMGRRKDQLAEQIRAAHRLGSASQLKMLLNQDNMSGMSRMLAYYQYFNQARVQQINRIRGQMDELEANQQAILIERSRLRQTQSQQQRELQALDDRRGRQRELVTELNRRIGAGEDRLAELRRNQADLEQLLQRLSRALADIPDALGTDIAISEQKGHLPAPVNGRRQFGFGDIRGGGLRWQGWQFAVAAGTEVRSIAYGRVAFADWLRGYGLLMIIDHGDGFMSLYGHNDSLLKAVGDWVQPGETISLSGINSTLGSAGLYFELRKDGKAINPGGWIGR